MRRGSMSLPQRTALRFLAGRSESALIEDIAPALQDTKPRARGVMRDLYKRSLVTLEVFWGMTGEGERMHKTRLHSFKISEAGRQWLKEHEEAGMATTEITRSPGRPTQSHTAAAMEVCLLALIDLVEDQGGVRRSAADNWEVIGQPPDYFHVVIGEIYTKACRALKRRAKTAP